MLDRTQKRVGHGTEKEVGDGRGEIRRGETEKGIYLYGWHVTEFLTKSCMFTYEWHCMTMCTSIILIPNLPTESQMNGTVHEEKEDEQVKQHYYVTSSQKLY